MSTLTTTTASDPPRHINLAAESNDKNVNGEIPTLQEDDAEELTPPLKHIWDCAIVERKNSPNGWEHFWCRDVFVPVYATRVLFHVLRLRGWGIKPCKAAVPANSLAQYQALRDKGESQADSKKRSVKVAHDIVETQQSASVATLHAKCSVAMSQPAGAHQGGTVISFPRSMSCHKVLSSAVSSLHPSISAGIQHQMDICKVNNALAQMAIADFFHCENIPDIFVELPRFKRMVSILSKVGPDFEIPKQRQIGGPLLDLNFQTKDFDNKTNLLKSADVFGLGFLGNGATVNRMPLMNIIASCLDTPPTTISIYDCMKNLQEGGKKDAMYVAALFEDKVREYNTNDTLTDVFFFNVVSNVQKAGEMWQNFLTHSVSMGESM
jgi:hypothetical protein